MRYEITAIIERDGEWFVGYCPEITGADGQGRTVEECRASLAEAIALMLEDRGEDALRGVPPDASERRSWSDEAQLPAPPLAETRLLPGARGRGALALD
jgi:predicted RNase H-like HicB family nuclease